MKVVFIGSGNVATHLSKIILAGGNQILQVYSKTLSNAKKLALELNAEFTSNLQKIRKDGDIYFISVTDSAVPEVAKKINLGRMLVVHTSGSLPLDSVKRVSENFGVFYPMQTFSKEVKMDYSGIPIFVEANSKSNEKILYRLACEISGGKTNVHLLKSNQRKAVHLAAVFANNFPNHLFSIADEILKSYGLSFNLLKPLILQTAKKIQHNSPDKMQTGPAFRGDKKIIEEHLDMMKNRPAYQKMYQLLSESISNNGVNNKSKFR